MEFLKLCLLLFLSGNCAYGQVVVQQRPPTSEELSPIIARSIPGVTYPIYASVPPTNFSCTGRPPGYFADPESQCQSFHRCDASGRMHSQMCANMTIYNQVTLTCDWFFNVDCENQTQYADLINSRLYGPQGQQQDLWGANNTVQISNWTLPPGFEAQFANDTPLIRAVIFPQTVPDNARQGRGESQIEAGSNQSAAASGANQIIFLSLPHLILSDVPVTPASPVLDASPSAVVIENVTAVLIANATPVAVVGEAAAPAVVPVVPVVAVDVATTASSVIVENVTAVVPIVPVVAVDVATTASSVIVENVTAVVPIVPVVAVDAATTASSATAVVIANATPVAVVGEVAAPAVVPIVAVDAATTASPVAVEEVTTVPVVLVEGTTSVVVVGERMTSASHGSVPSVPVAVIAETTVTSTAPSVALPNVTALGVVPVVVPESTTSASIPVTFSDGRLVAADAIQASTVLVPLLDVITPATPETTAVTTPAVVAAEASTILAIPVTVVGVIGDVTTLPPA